MSLPHRLAASLSVAASLALALAGCASSAEPDPGSGAIVGDVLVGGARRERPLEQSLGANGHHVIFVNFDGVTVQPDYDDATRDRSSIAANVGHAITVPAFSGGPYSSTRPRDQIIGDVMALVRGYYADFNVDLVTARPTSGNYVMCAVGGQPDLIGQPCANNGCVLGLAPLDCSPGNPVNYNVQDDVEVVFAFSDAAKYFQSPYSAKINELADTIAQETAHAYGLGHSNNVRDVMYPQVTGQTTGFLSGSYADNGNCAGSVGIQDAHAVLLDVLGSHVADTEKPTVAITSPTAYQTLPFNFVAAASATDNVGVAQVVFVATGPGGKSVSHTASAAPWRSGFTVDAEGSWTLVATASDGAGNSADAKVTFTVSATAPMQAAPGSPGAACTGPADCDSHVCAATGLRKYCSQTCTLGDPKSCPATMTCQSFGADGDLCALRSGGGASGCALSPSSGGARGGLALLALLLVAISRRRRR